MSKREIAFVGLVAVGLACITFGAGLAWTPAYFIMGGLSIVILAILTMVEV